MPENERQEPLLLAHQTTIVTGAAKGIGRGIAIEMARVGANVVLADVDEEGMDETKRLITASGGLCLSIHADVQDTEQGHRLVDAALQQFGNIDILVNNAGINTPGARRMLEISPDSYDRVLRKAFCIDSKENGRLQCQIRKSGTYLSLILNVSNASVRRATEAVSPMF